MDPWVDPTDPDIIEAITGSPSNSTGVEEAVNAASEVLTMLTGFRVHSSGVATEEYVAKGRIIRLTPSYKPVTDLISVYRVSPDCFTTTDVSDEYCLYGGSIRAMYTSTGVPVGGNPVLCNFCSAYHDKLRINYEFGSTVGAAGRRAATIMSRQLWLFDNPEAGECALPERVVSMSREGLSYSFIDPMNFLDQGRTGVPSVDMYLSAVNPSKAKVPAAVYIPEAPPGVVR